jgi:hypothetical protein
VVPGLGGCLGQLLDGHGRRRDVGIAEAEVDDVVACPPELQLQPFDLREGVGREAGDPSKLDHRDESQLYISQPVG